MNNTTSEPSPYPSSGDLIDGKYRCDRVVGVGGMGAVALATHVLRKAPVALKFMNPAIMTEPSAVERFINEAIAASRIDSEHVVKIFDVSQMHDGAPYLVMEYLEGQDLSDLLMREGKPGIESVPRAVHLVIQVLRGLQVAHYAGIVHRDMKPSNCFVINKDGEPDFVKLLDFGISKVQQPGGISLTRTNSMLGTPLYMAPEQARSAKYADARTDLYAAGVILYEILSGRTPYDPATGELTELLLNIFSAEAPPVATLRPDMPKELCAVVHRCFARDPANRFQSAWEMIEGLAPWADERSRSVIEGARRRAAREGSAPALGSNAPPPLPDLSAIGPAKAAAATAHRPQESEVAERSETTGLATSMAQPGPAAVVRKRTGWALLLAAGLLVAGLVVGILALGNLRAGPELPAASPLASAEASAVAHFGSSSPPAPALSPAGASSDVIVITPSAPSTSAPRVRTTRASPTSTAVAAPPRRADAGRPRIGDIGIQQ
jgi:serine/threonine-protein kinase